jgi:hypothetical protein
LRNRADIGGYDIDARGAGEQNGGYVVAAGSRHATGVDYLAQDSGAAAVPLPEWVLDWLREVDSAEVDHPGSTRVSSPDLERRYTLDQAAEWVTRYAVEPLKAATEGHRNDALNTAAIVVGHFVPAFWDEEWATERLVELAEQVGLDDSEIGPTIRSGLRAGMGQPYSLVEARDPFASGSGSSGAPNPESTWLPKDLDALWDGAVNPLRPTVLARKDAHCLFYLGKTHSVHGESESGKSWVAQVAVIETLRAGGRVAYLDYESDERAILERLRLLGLEREWLARLDYVTPDGPRDGQFEALLGQAYQLAVIDGVTAAIAAEQDARSNNSDDVTLWDIALPRRIATQTGAAVVLIDHVSKAKDERGRFAIGAQAKMANVSGSAFYVDVEAVLAPGRKGCVRLYVGKDRPGQVRRHAGPMRPDRLQPFARLTVDGSVTGVVSVALWPWVGKVEDQDDPDVTHEAHLGPLWWERKTEELPDVVQKLSGPGARTAQDLWRLLDHIADPDGRTPAELRAVFGRELLPERQPSKSDFHRAVGLLRNAGIVPDTGRLTLD